MLQISCYEASLRSFVVISSRKSFRRCSKGKITLLFSTTDACTHCMQDYVGGSHPKKENVIARPASLTPPTNLRKFFFLSSVLQTRDITFLFPTKITVIPSQTIAGRRFFTYRKRGSGIDETIPWKSAPIKVESRTKEYIRNLWGLSRGEEEHF